MSLSPCDLMRYRDSMMYRCLQRWMSKTIRTRQTLTSFCLRYLFSMRTTRFFIPRSVIGLVRQCLTVLRESREGGNDFHCVFPREGMEGREVMGCSADIYIRYDDLGMIAETQSLFLCCLPWLLGSEGLML